MSDGNDFELVKAEPPTRQRGRRPGVTMKTIDALRSAPDGVAAKVPLSGRNTQGLRCSFIRAATARGVKIRTWVDGGFVFVQLTSRQVEVTR